METETFGGTTAIYCITEKRLATLYKKGLFNWNYESYEWNLVSTVEIQEGLLNCTIIVTGKKLSKKDTYKEVRERAARLKGVNKVDGRRFVAVAQDCIYNYSEAESYRTKTCPECDEIVKWKAKRCKYCGYKF